MECWLVLGVLCRIWTSDGFPPPRILKTKKFKVSVEIDIESIEGSAATSFSNNRLTYPLDSVRDSVTGACVRCFDCLVN